MTSLQGNQDRQAPIPLDCDQCGRCGSDVDLCGRRIPALLMPPGTIERLRAIEMHTLALSDDEIQAMDEPTQLGLSF